MPTAILTADDMVARLFAKVTIASWISALGLILALHLLKPDLEPSWRFLSEYSTGEFGGLMSLCFMLMGLSHASLILALRPRISTFGGNIGLAILAVSVVGVVIAGIYPMDLLTTDPNHPTRDGNLHGLGSMLGMPTLPIAAVLIAYALRREAPEPARKWLLWSAHFTWISLAVMMAMMFTLLPANGGRFSPDIPAGWLNRVVVLAMFGWVMVTADYLLQRSPRATLAD